MTIDAVLDPRAAHPLVLHRTLMYNHEGLCPRGWHDRQFSDDKQSPYS
jgi:hypothetical protein